MQLHELGAAEIVGAVASGLVSPVEVVQACLDRITATEPMVGAWATVDADGALEAARDLERRRRERLPRELLFGLPIGLKDIIHARGLPTRASFAPYQDTVIQEDAGVVRFLRDAGAIILGKTVTVQFALGQDPPGTRNPWDLARTPGGSSTGSAAAVAARQVSAAIGTQTTGSLLRPASYCGVVGLKPTFGRVSVAGIYPTSWASDHPGTVTRSVTDAALLLQAVARHDPRDPYCVDRPADDYLGAVRRAAGRPPRLALVTDLLERATPAVRECAQWTAARLREAGAVVEDAPLPVSFELAQAVHWLMLSCDAGAIHGHQYSKLAEHYGPRIGAYIEVGQLLPASAYIHAARLKRRLRAQLMAFVEDVDAVLAPAAPDLPPLIAPPSGEPTLGDPSFQGLWTSFGLPAITIPAGLSPEGLPIGMQLIGVPFGERDLLAVARWCENLMAPLPEPTALLSAAATAEARA